MTEFTNRLKLLLALICLSTGFTTCSSRAVENLRRQRPVEILVLGNSITQHNQDISIGWLGTWGMAASSIDKDYVHLLIKDIEKFSPESKLKYFNIAQSFERRFWDYDTSNINVYRSLQPDIVVFRLGDNINEDSLKKYSVGIALRKLVNHIIANKKAKIIVTSSFWTKQILNKELKQYSIENNWNFVDISDLSKDSVNLALNEFQNKAVASHPSDEGMNKIYIRLQPLLRSAITEVQR
jgi:hypothetical protein